MKKVLAVTLTLIMCVSLCSCGANIDSNSGVTEIETETTTTLISVISNGVLQYPSSNENFKYNVYDTYIEITEYIGVNDADEVIVPSTLENLPVYVVDYNVFSKCDVKSIIIEDGVFYLRTNFSPSLKSIELPGSIGSVGLNQFKNCYALEKVILNEGIEFIHNDAFMHCGIKTITLPSTIMNIGSGAFSFSKLESITIPSGVEEIADNCFMSCESLKSIELPNTITTIGEHAFQGCDSLESLVIPDSVTEIKGGAFTACSSLTSLTIPASVTTMGTIVFSQHNENLTVYGAPGSAAARACATENVFFKVSE